MVQFLQGLKSAFLGFQECLKDSKYKTALFLSFLVNFIVLVLFFLFLKQFVFEGLISWFGLTVWLSGAGVWAFLVQAIVSVVLFLISVFFIYSLFLVVASPFYSLISSSILEKAGFVSETPFLKRTLRMLKASVLKTLVFLFVFGFFILLFMWIFPPAALFLTSFVMSMDSMDYTLENCEKSFMERMRFFKKFFFYFLGQSVFLSLFSFFPPLLFLIVPFCVGGSALFYKSCKKQNRV